MPSVIVDADDISVHEAPVPEPAPGEVLVATLLAGVCGSDTHAAHGRHPFIDLPYAPGHEILGVVVRTAADADGLDVGQRVVVEPDLCWVTRIRRRSLLR